MSLFGSYPKSLRRTTATKANIKFCPECSKEATLQEYIRWYLFSVYYYTCDDCRIAWFHRRKKGSLIFINDYPFEHINLGNERKQE